MFINKQASADIFSRKRKLEASLASIEKRYMVARHTGCFCFAGLQRWISRLRTRLQMTRIDISSDLINSCIVNPEFKALQYLHKLSQRIITWKRWPKKQLPFNELPREFRDVKGAVDPPHAEYSHLFEVSQILEATTSPQMQKTMLAWFVAQRMGCLNEISPKHQE